MIIFKYIILNFIDIVFNFIMIII